MLSCWELERWGLRSGIFLKRKTNEVLVKLEYVGICGSDLHYYETGAIGDYVVEPPFVLGHEPGGTVVEVGKECKDI